MMNYGRKMFFPLVCSVLWLTPNPAAATDAQRALEAGRTAAVRLTDASPGILATAQRIPAGEDSNPAGAPLQDAANLGCHCTLEDEDIPFNLDNPRQHIRTYQTYHNMHVCVDPKRKGVLYILEADCTEHKAAETARLLIATVLAKGEICTYLTTIGGKMVAAVYVINYPKPIGPQLHWYRTPCSQERLNSLEAHIWSNNKVLDEIRDQAAERKPN